jgi:palmitoyltransferase
MCLFAVPSAVEKVFYLIFYHPFIVMLAWSFWQAIFTPVVTTPKQFYLSSGDLERLECEVDRTIRREILDQFAKNLPVQCRTPSGEVRYCEKCKAIKPDRAHHCSMCGRCILKMDHHCPWINNCVCFSNYKFFVLFLMYALLYCLYVAFTSLQYFVQFWRHVGNTQADMGGLHIVFLFIVAVLFAICVLTLFGYHCFLLACNKSTIEAYQPPVFPSGPDKDGFNIGCYNNFIQVFGRDKRYWLLPFYSSIGDGVEFVSRVLPPPSQSYNSMESTVTTISISQTVPSIGDGVSYPIPTTDEDFDSLLGPRQSWVEDIDRDVVENGSQGYLVNDVVECERS